MNAQKKNSDWITSLLPFNIAIGPIGTLVPLYILALNGTVLEVSLAITLFNAVSIPTAIFWGFVTDRLQRRRPLIILSFSITAIFLTLLAYANSVILLSVMFALISFATAASTTPLNLLIMETRPKQKWATAFAKLSMITSTGLTAGLLISIIWATMLPLQYIVVLLAGLSLTSAALAALSIKEPNIVFERNVILLNKPSFIHRLRASPLFFLKIPKIYDFRKIAKNLKHDLTKHTPVLYISICFFFLSSGLFNTSLVPALQSKQVSNELILLVMGITTTTQTISFRYAGTFAEKYTLQKAALRGLLLRSTVFVLIALAALLSVRTAFFAAVMLLYPIAGGLAYAIYYTSSNTMIFNGLRTRGQGSNLGVFSALTGVALMSGSFLSGLASFFLGYATTFIIAAICLIISAWLTNCLDKI